MLCSAHASPGAGAGDAGSPGPPLPPLAGAPHERKRHRRPKEELAAEKASFFADLINLRACKVRHPENFAFHLTTDGVSARLVMARKPASVNLPMGIPSRGLWCIDELKARAHGRSVHVVGVDPGKRELLVAVDMDDSHEGDTKKARRGKPAVRYTQAQRARETRCKEYCTQVLEREKRSMELVSTLCSTSSRSASMESFTNYLHARRRVLDECLELHKHINVRKRRWKSYMKTQRSEARLMNKLHALHDISDSRPLVLAYGAWGLVAGRPGLACNKGNPPCIGVGLMRKLAKHFVVALTPEAYTSKTCCRCLPHSPSFKPPPTPTPSLSLPLPASHSRS